MAINHEVLLAPSGYRPGMQLNMHNTAPPQRTGIETNVDHVLSSIPKTVGGKNSPQNRSDNADTVHGAEASEAQPQKPGAAPHVTLLQQLRDPPAEAQDVKRPRFLNVLGSCVATSSGKSVLKEEVGIKS